MLTANLYDYVENIIHKDDDYDLTVLYYHLRKLFIDNDFSLENVETIHIDKTFHSEPISVNLNKGYYSIQKSIALLLSVRTMAFDKYIFDYCNHKVIFFKPESLEPYEWVRYTTTIVNHLDDEDFDNLFGMLEEVEYNEELSEESKQRFIDLTVVPPRKNLLNYYRELAEANDTNQTVIGDNAYVGNTELSELNIPRKIEYVGNTAIAYCPRLKKIIFNRKDTLFGKFPIIECNNLKLILVPEGSEAYYQEQLPYYKDIIGTEDLPDETFVAEPNPVSESVKSSDIEQIDDSGNEQVSPSQALESTTDKAAEDSTDFEIIYKVFKNKSTTYKYFWLLAILEIAHEKQFLHITYKEIIPHMIADAWPLINDRINFGKMDKFRDIVQSLIILLNLSVNASKEEIENTLVEHYDDERVNKVISILNNNVPYRFLSPWVKFSSNKQVTEASQSITCETPYALYTDSIILDENWFDYLNQNYEKLHSFTRNELMAYLKSYNSDFSLLRFMMES